MRTEILVNIPPMAASSFAGQSKAAAIRQLATLAVTDGLALLEPVMSSSEKWIDFSVCPEVLDASAAVSEKTGLPIGKVISGYIAAAYTKIHGADPEAVPAPKEKQISATVNQDIRTQAQQRFYGQIREAMFTPDARYVLAEGGTGIGKTRVIAGLAAEMAPKYRVVVAAPTVENIYHHVNEWYTVTGGNGVGIGVVLGKGQFFDPELLSDLCESNEDTIAIPDEAKERALAWVRKGALPPSGSPSSSLLRACPGISHLIDDLLFVTPEFEAYTELIAIPYNRGPGENEGESLDTGPYREAIAAAAEAPVVYCTHAMLANHIRLMKLNPEAVSSLGEFQALLVDEAHLLESAVANASTEGLSLFSLLHTLRQGESRQKVRDAAIASCLSLMEICSKGELDEGLFWKAEIKESSRWKEFCAEASSLLTHLSELTKKSRGRAGGGERNAQILSAQAALLRFLSPQNSPVHLKLSPVRKFPSLTVGSRTVVPLFETFFESMKKVLLTSGTLFLEKDSGELSPQYILRNLGLDINTPGLVALAPVKTPWLHDCVTFHYAEPGSSMYFEPPVADSAAYKDNPGRYDIDRHGWLSQLAGSIQMITRSVAGGTLVLCTSYEDIGTIRRIIGDDLDGRLMVAGRGMSTRLQKAQFISRAKAGERPVWLALGGAWTGLDLSDPELPVNEDKILTDLVIAKLPFNLNQSMSYLVRTAVGKGFRKLAARVREQEAAFWFKQGVGRLIRRPGVTDRHLWILDGRLWVRKQRYAELRGVLTPYWRRKPLL